MRNKQENEYIIISVIALSISLKLATLICRRIYVEGRDVVTEH